MDLLALNHQELLVVDFARKLELTSEGKAHEVRVEERKTVKLKLMLKAPQQGTYVTASNI